MSARDRLTAFLAEIDREDAWITRRNPAPGGVPVAMDIENVLSALAAAEERAHGLEVECRELQHRLGQQEDNAKAAEERAATAEAAGYDNLLQAERDYLAETERLAARVGVLEDALRRIASEDRLDRSGFSHVRQFALAALSGPRGDKAASE